MRIFTLVALAAAALMAGPAQAADNGFYLGASIGQSSADVPGEIEEIFDDEDTSYKIIAGFRPLDWLAVEASYTDLGEVRQTEDIPDLANFRASEKALSAFGLLMFDISAVDLFVKAGLVQWDADISADMFGDPVSDSDDGTDFAWGVGGQVRLGSLAIRAEFERFQIDNSDGLFSEPQMFSLGLTWTFL